MSAIIVVCCFSAAWSELEHTSTQAIDYRDLELRSIVRAILDRVSGLNFTSLHDSRKRIANVVAAHYFLNCAPPQRRCMIAAVVVSYERVHVSQPLLLKVRSHKMTSGARILSRKHWRRRPNSGERRSTGAPSFASCRALRHGSSKSITAASAQQHLYVFTGCHFRPSDSPTGESCRLYSPVKWFLLVRLTETLSSSSVQFSCSCRATVG